MQNIEFTVGQFKATECFREGWEFIKPHYWMMFAITLVGMLIASIIPFGIALGALNCGLYYVLFQMRDGKAPDFSDLFKGINYFVPSLIATMILIIPIVISTIVMWVSMVGVMFSMTDSRGRIDESAIFALYGTMLVEGLIVAIVLSCIHAFIIFTYPLIVEYNLSGIESFKLSAKAAWANLGGVISLILCQFGLAFVGYLLCGIGLYLTLPIMWAGVFVAYQKVFPHGNRANLDPPPPSIYQNL